MAKQTEISYESTKEWKDFQTGGTRIDAADLNNMEQGISDACAGVDELRTKRLPTYLVAENGDTATQDVYSADILGPCLILDLATRTTYYDDGEDGEGHERKAITSGADIDALRDSVSRTPTISGGVTSVAFHDDKDNGQLLDIDFVSYAGSRQIGFTESEIFLWDGSTKRSIPWQQHSVSQISIDSDINTITFSNVNDKDCPGYSIQLKSGRRVGIYAQEGVGFVFYDYTANKRLGTCAFSQHSVSQTPSFTSYLDDQGSSSISKVGTCVSLVVNVVANKGFSATHNLFTFPTWAIPSVIQLVTAKINSTVTHATITPSGQITVASDIKASDSILIWGSWVVEP